MWLCRAGCVAVLSLAVACTGSYDGPGGVTGGSAHTLVSAEFAAMPAESLTTFRVYTSSVIAINTADTTVALALSRAAATLDLLNLVTSVTTAVGPVSAPQGDYDLRLVVDSVRVGLLPPRMFANGDSARTLTFPGGLRTALAHPVTLGGTSGNHETFVAYFDPTRSLAFSSARNPVSVTFTPLLYAIQDTLAATIDGTVTPASSHAVVYGVVGADTLATDFADTLTGAFTLRFLPPGDVTVIAAGTGLNVRKTVATVAGRDTTGITLP